MGGKAMLYIINLHGGPNDGEVIHALRPYFILNINGAVYEGQDGEDTEYDWIDDERREVTLNYRGQSTEDSSES